MNSGVFCHRSGEEKTGNETLKSLQHSAELLIPSGKEVSPFQTKEGREVKLADKYVCNCVESNRLNLLKPETGGTL